MDSGTPFCRKRQKYPSADDARVSQLCVDICPHGHKIAVVLSAMLYSATNIWRELPFPPVLNI